MDLIRRLAHIVLCVGLLFQVSAPAAALPQAETMSMSMSMMDCAKMKHHSLQESGHAGHSGNTDGLCKDMSLACMASISAAAPAFLDSEATHITGEFFVSSLLYDSDGEAQLLSRHSAPDYPPPRL